jgi:ankyrin repeat protein
MELLLDYNQDGLQHVDDTINSRNTHGATALTRSVAWSASRSVKFLLSRGALYTGDFERDADGRTLLHIAALNTNIDMVRVLLDARLTGLDPDAKDNEGKTALDYIDGIEPGHLPNGFVPAFRHLLADIRERYYGVGIAPGPETSTCVSDSRDISHGHEPPCAIEEVDNARREGSDEEIFFDASESLSSTVCAEAAT